MKAIPSCRIDILDGLIVDVPYEYSDLETQVAEHSGDIVLSIVDIDVDTARMDPAPSGRIELDLSERASELHGPGLGVLRNRAFRVSCADELLFLGLIYDRNGAAAIQAPVLHVEEDDAGLVTLLIGSSLGVWTGVGNYPAPELNARIDHPELRAAFCARGALAELEPR